MKVLKSIASTRGLMMCIKRSKNHWASVVTATLVLCLFMLPSEQVSAGDVFTPRPVTLFQLHDNGAIWHYTDRPCTADACPGWTLIDRNTRTEAISDIYQRHVDGKIWVWDQRSRCTTDACPGWTLIDRNERTKDIVAAQGSLFQRHVDGKIWKWSGEGCIADACPGWTLIDRNERTKDIVAAQRTLFQRHVDGKIWKWSGGSGCTADACPGWTLIDRNPHTKAIEAVDTKFGTHPLIL